MTLILKLDLDMVKMYLHAKKWGFHVKGFKSYSLNRQTHSQTDMTENITYLDTQVVINQTWIKREQECIPVGCVPAARWPYAAVCLWGGVCSWGGAPGGCLLPGGLLWGGVCSRGVCLLQGDGVSQHALRQTPPLWTEFLAHACENITLAQLRCGR